MSQQDSGYDHSDSNAEDHHHHHHHHHHDDSFGDFQANVGKVGAKASVVGAWIFAIVIGIIGLVMAVFAFIPRYKDPGCKDELATAEKSLDNCNTARKSQPALPDQTIMVGNTCDDEKDQVESLKKSCKKTRNYLLLLGLLMIPIGVLIVWGAKAWDRKVQSSRSAAQFSGALTEASIISDMMRR